MLRWPGSRPHPSRVTWRRQPACHDPSVSLDSACTRIGDSGRGFGFLALVFARVSHYFSCYFYTIFIKIIMATFSASTRSAAAAPFILQLLESYRYGFGGTYNRYLSIEYLGTVLFVYP